MGFAAAIPAAVTAATSGATLAGLSTGLMVAGTAISAVGAITGSSTLSKIGAFTGLAGGVGSMAAGALGVGEMALTGAGGLLSSGRGAAASGAAAQPAPSATVAPSRPTTLPDFEKQFLPPDVARTATTKNLSNIPSNGVLAPEGAVTETFKKKLEVGELADLLKKYDTTATLLGGMGQGFAAYQQYKLGERSVDLREREQQFSEDQARGRLERQGVVPTLRFNAPGLLNTR